MAEVGVEVEVDDVDIQNGITVEHFDMAIDGCVAHLFFIFFINNLTTLAFAFALLFFWLF